LGRNTVQNFADQANIPYASRIAFLMSPDDGTGTITEFGELGQTRIPDSLAGGHIGNWNWHRYGRETKTCIGRNIYTWGLSVVAFLNDMA
jgi:hypothetical protein